MLRIRNRFVGKRREGLELLVALGRGGADELERVRLADDERRGRRVADGDRRVAAAGTGQLEGGVAVLAHEVLDEELAAGGGLAGGRRRYPMPRCGTGGPCRSWTTSRGPRPQTRRPRRPCAEAADGDAGGRQRRPWRPCRPRPRRTTAVTSLAAVDPGLHTRAATGKTFGPAVTLLLSRPITSHVNGVTVSCAGAALTGPTMDARRIATAASIVGSRKRRDTGTSVVDGEWGGTRAGAGQGRIRTVVPRRSDRMRSEWATPA